MSVIYDGCPINESARIFKYAQKTSANAYAYMAGFGFFDISSWAKCLITLTAATNVLAYKIEASQSGAVWTEIKAETVLAVGATDFETLSDAWLFLRIAIKSNVADTHGVMTVRIGAKK